MNDLEGNPLPKFNNAQEAHIEYWGNLIHTVPEHNAKEQTDSLRLFVSEFLKIDPTPDPELWVINMYTDFGDVYSSAYSPNGKNGGTKEECDKVLLTMLRETSDGQIVEFKAGDYLKERSGDTWKVEKK